MPHQHAPNADRLSEPVDLADVTALPDEQLARGLLVLREEQKRRALQQGDLPALIEEGFAHGFTANGLPRDPWLHTGIIICPGGKIDKSAMNHQCAFVRVGDEWVWNAGETLEDVVRHRAGPKPQMQSVSLLPAVDGLALDLVRSRTRNAVHELVGVRSFLVEDQQLQLVSARTVSKISHR